jgi:hypothetical protein
MRRMTEEEWHALSGRHSYGQGRDCAEGRRPHVVPVWFVLDREDVMFTTGASR